MACALADIKLQHARLAAKRSDRLRHAIGFFTPAAAMHDDIVIVARQAQSDGFADTSTRAGN